VLDLWLYFWDPAAWESGTVTCAQKKQQCSATAEVTEVVPAAGGWQEYEYVLSLNTPHWSAPRRKPPQPVQELVATVECVQAKGQVMATADWEDTELEMCMMMFIAA
jgi:hypothetical protein